MSDIGNMTYGLRANAKDVSEIWFRMPGRRAEFGPQEIRDLQETLIGIAAVLRGIEKANRKIAA